MLEQLKEKVYRANLDMVRHKLILFNWSNVSGIDSECGLVVIKPSRVSYNTMRPDDMVVEEVAKMDYLTFTLNPQARISELLVEKHFSRKHGPHAYYGQENK